MEHARARASPVSAAIFISLAGFHAAVAGQPHSVSNVSVDGWSFSEIIIIVINHQIMIFAHRADVLSHPPPPPPLSYGLISPVRAVLRNLHGDNA